MTDNEWVWAVLKRCVMHLRYRSVHDTQFLKNVVKQGFVSEKQKACVKKIEGRLDVADTWKDKPKKNHGCWQSDGNHPGYGDNFESFDHGFGMFGD